MLVYCDPLQSHFSSDKLFFYQLISGRDTGLFFRQVTQRYNKNSKQSLTLRL